MLALKLLREGVHQSTRMLKVSHRELRGTGPYVRYELATDKADLLLQRSGGYG
jgi:hypothetical protein